MKARNFVNYSEHCLLLLTVLVSWYQFYLGKDSENNSAIFECSQSIFVVKLCLIFFSVHGLFQQKYAQNQAFAWPIELE